jgi:hypothetical protein
MGVQQVKVSPGRSCSVSLPYEYTQALIFFLVFLDGKDLPDPRYVGHPDAEELLSLLEEVDQIDVPDTAG